MEPQEKSPSLGDCLKLLRGERDEQRLAGLLLATKFSKGDDLSSLRAIYDAVGVRFLDRLLRTGLKRGCSGGGENGDAYLQLSATLLAAFCRVPDIASSQEMLSKIPLFLEILNTEGGSSILEEVFEFLYLVISANEGAVAAFFENEGAKVLAPHISTLPDDSHLLEVVVKIEQLLATKPSMEVILAAYPGGLAIIVAGLARQFAVLHNALKFEVLHLLSAIFSQQHKELLHEALRAMSDPDWSSYVYVGVVDILQNRVAPAEKLHALILAESSSSIVGERWLIEPVKLPDIRESPPADRCLLLVLESSRVEIAVLLNDLAYLKYEATKSSSSNLEITLLKQQNLAVAFALVEKIIRLIAILSENAGDVLDEITFSKVINGLNETISAVIEYLEDSKDHGVRKGDDLLASVRVVGSYLAEAPMACKDKVRELLPYMLSVEGNDEHGPFFSICFLLPILCQTTMDTEGCKLIASLGVDRSVVDCLLQLISPDAQKVGDLGSISLACDTVMNLLLKKGEVKLSLSEPTYINLLKALALWTESQKDSSLTMMASSICSLILECTSEEVLLRSFSQPDLNLLSQLIVKGLVSNKPDVPIEDMAEEDDLCDIVKSGYSGWAPRFPCLCGIIEQELDIID
ncbi:hypothetical protein MLD38_026589 [Melastoma candidum]|uniref:Uncharacterized protein n=1 Tax=Melastoma candidum TaxID=119954 RepID=A0ACB9NZ19_9MYRT|nr:hypothetical protein MLD38_026589 [Melastoma candidum]